MAIRELRQRRAVVLLIVALNYILIRVRNGWDQQPIKEGLLASASVSSLPPVARGPGRDASSIKASERAS